MRSSIDRARRADLAVLDLERVERQHAGARTGTATRAAPRSPLRACRRRSPPRSPSKKRVAGRLELLRRGRSRPARRRRRRRRRPRPRSRPAPRGAAGPTRRSRARPRSRTGGRPSPRARTPSAGCTGGHRDRLERGAEALVALVGDHDRRRLVRAVDRELLGDVVGVRAGEPGRAHEDQRLGREVDVLLVLGAVAGDRLVAELGELDPHLVRGDPVRAVADDRPVAPRRARAAARRRRSPRAARAPAPSRRAGRAARASSVDPVLGRARGVSSSASANASRKPGGDLRVERLGRGDAHLHVAAVGRVEHAVAAVDEIAVAPVHDRDHGRAARRARGRRCGWCRWWCRSG